MGRENQPSSSARPYRCPHHELNRPKLRRLLERIKSSSSQDFKCHTCLHKAKRGPGRPLKVKKVAEQGPLFQWICVHCDRKFCGISGEYGPDGHILKHAVQDSSRPRHPLAIQLDKPNDIFCFRCYVKEPVTPNEEEGEENWELESKVEAQKTKLEKIMCSNCKSASTELKQILGIIKSPSSEGLKCQTCDTMAVGHRGRGKRPMPPNNREEGSVLWGCLDCEQILCGEEKDTSPSGHVANHGLITGHSLYACLDPSGKVWCSKCNSYRVTATNDENVKVESAEKQQVVSNPVSRGKSGCEVKKLPNKGNTCYFNAALQNLLAMDKLRESLASLKKPDNNTAKALKWLFIETYDNSKDIIDPECLLYAVRRHGKFEKGNQHDSNELFTHIVTELQSEKVKFANEIFEGELSIMARCARCGHTWTQHFPFLNLFLCVPSKKDLIERARNVSPNLPLPRERDGHENGEIAGTSSVAETDIAQIPRRTRTPTLKLRIARSSGSKFKRIEACKVNHTNDIDVSIEECLDSYIKPEDVSGNCDNCSGNLQHQQPSEATGPQMDGDKSSSTRNASNHNSVECDEHSLAAVPRSSQVPTETDQLSKHDKFNSSTTRMFLINRPPLILTIQLNIFRQMESGGFEKIKEHIVFNEMLDLTPYMDRSPWEKQKEKHLYRLIGMVRHLGNSLERGHYTAFVRREKGEGVKAWFMANDDRVEEVQLADVLKHDPYILFYERVESSSDMHGNPVEL